MKLGSWAKADFGAYFLNSPLTKAINQSCRAWVPKRGSSLIAHRLPYSIGKPYAQKSKQAAKLIGG
jgi:hypothetical protein